MSTPAPTKINLGSGKDFKPDYLNIDVSPYWSPDILADVSGDFPAGGRQTFATRRFGDIEVAHGGFDEIVCNDVLEHVPDLVRTMTNGLNLLKVGGLFNIMTPYDLSYGAWQDPTHVRAFNERSWLYYTDWFWYLGWTESRFVMRRLDYIISPVGRDLRARGEPQDVILRTPRAVDSMKVCLEKITLSEADQAALRNFTPG
ncbi:methyltransferase domain-containing protein [Phenylobacterium aquaticum]|uniref:methyltransferase domain-containing protein n=2 Tax=Phenylobacterium aquaticum TaxID=1763816 RepID=UPI0026EC2968|nr:methyltransferase domain-containing protein [Phenylobacterium aquaticum]